MSHFAFIFDFKYKSALQIVKEKGYFEKLYNRFEFKDKETENRMKKIYKEVKKYLEGVLEVNR